MFLISGPELVIAACKAGIVGAFPTPNARPIEVLGDWMRRITDGLARARDEQPAHTLGPWCANLVTHRSNERLPDDLKLVAKYQPPVVVTALGSPKPAIEVVHGYGGQVFADVTTIALARKAVEAGADGLACVCAGAGGHTGQINPFAFVSAVREFFSGTIVVGGGISDGWGLAGALACGADYVYMGTRFIATAESMAKPEYKQMLVDSSVEDLIVSAGLTGTPASWLRPSLRANGLDPDNLPDAPQRNYNSNQNLASKRWMDVWAAGQGVGAVREVEPVAVVVDRIEREFNEARARFGAWAPAAAPATAPALATVSGNGGNGTGSGSVRFKRMSDGAMTSDNPLLGSWQLVRWDISYGDGRPPSLPYGDQATGLIVYTGDGFMSACIAASGRAPMSSASVRSAPEAERLAAFESYFQYAGRYELRRAASGLQVVHSVSHSLNPNFVGSEQVRNVAFDADGVLTLSASDTVPNSVVARHHRLMWKRAA